MSGKTPAHLFCYVGPSWGGRGKSFYPRPSVPRLRRKSIVAPPLLAKPVPRGAGVLHEINFYQNSTHHLIPKAPLQRLIREIAATESEVSCSPGLSLIILTVSCQRDIRFSPQSLHALQEAAEAYLVKLLRESTILADHAGRITLRYTDMRLLLRLRELGN